MPISRRLASLVTLLALTMTAGVPAASATEPACRAHTAPVVTLDFGSRYADGDASRSTLDSESSAAVTAALRPVDDFIRALARGTNAVLRDPAGQRARAACLVAAIGTWAEADALSDMQSFNAGLAVGSRIAGIAEAYRLLRPHAPGAGDAKAIAAWLDRRSRDQIDFWEIEATSGARNGNLRAWANLAVLLAAEVTGDDFAQLWAYASTARILCTARADGSLPQETKRGAYALHYQLHAVAPLVLTATHARRQGHAITALCDRALPRVVAFALQDYADGGTASAAYSGEAQQIFNTDPARQAQAFAWLPAYLSWSDDPAARAMSARFDRFASSKLGGDQALIWGTPHATAITAPLSTALDTGTGAFR